MIAAEQLPAELVDAAISYAGKGLPVFPCNPENKRPLTKRGFEDAATDPEQIRRWWAKWPNAMIGMPTGERSGFWALDVDDPVLFESQTAVNVPATRRCDTGKGYHLLFRFDPSSPVSNSQRHPKTGWPFTELPGAEARGNGGYVIVPPSLHPSGRHYAWHDDTKISQAPDKLLSIVQKKHRNSYENGNQVAPGGDTPYCLAALEDECASIRNAPGGAQEGALNEAALKMGHYVAGEVLSHDTARSRLIAAGLSMASCNPRDPWTVENVTRKVDRSLQDGMAKPKSVPHSNKGGDRFNPKTGEVIENATGEGRTMIEPVDLWQRYSTPPLPKNLLPEVIENFARQHGEVMGVDPSGLAMAALAVCAAATSDEIKLQVKDRDDTWRESARLWVGLVGAPSSKKTPIMNAAIRPLRAIDGNLMRAYMAKIADYEALPAKEKKTASKPKQERRIISDSTVEAAQEVLKDSPRGVLSSQDELSGWFGQMDKYAPGKGAMADRGFWLQAFNGGAYSINRVGRGASYIPNCSVSLLGGIQPEPIRAIVGDAQDDGLIQRLIPVVLRPGSIDRDIPAGEAVTQYDRLIEKLETLRPEPVGGGNVAQFSAQLLRFAPEASAIRREMAEEHLGLVRALEEVSPKLSAHFGKHDGLFARLCILWHCIDATSIHPNREISGHTAQRVAAFMREFIRPSAIAFYAGLLGMSAGHEDIVAVASWVVANGLEEVKARDVQSSSQAFRHFTADQVRQICEKLEAFGWGEWGEPPARSNKPPFRVNPLVHERFADRGREEKERRAQVRAIIQETLRP